MACRSSTRTRRASSSSTSIRSSSCAARRARCSAATRSAAWSPSPAAGRRWRSGPARWRCRSPITARGRSAAACPGRCQKDRLAVGFSVAQVSRDGFTVNDVTGNDLDSRSAFSVKGQVLWTPDPNWEARVIVTGERARDGDYGLHDVAALRANPFHAARDFEGFADRDVFGTTIQVRRIGWSARLLEHDRHPEVDDARPDRSRLHAAAVAAARQRRRGPAVHAGAARRVLGAGANPAVRRASACAGRPACSSSRRATNRTRSTASRRSSSRRSRCRSTRRDRRSTTTASACSARRR